MSVDVCTEIEIRRPRDAVAAYASGPDNVTSWYENMRSVEWLTPPPFTAGSRIAFKARFLGRSLSYTYEVRELVPGERLVMSTTDGAFPMETTYTWTDAPDGATTMTLRNRGEPTGFAPDDAGHEQCDAPGQPQGPGPPEVDPGGQAGRVRVRL